MKRISVLFNMGIIILVMAACQNTEAEVAANEPTRPVEATAVSTATDVPPTATEVPTELPTEVPPTEPPAPTNTPEPTPLPELVGGDPLPDFGHELSGPFALGGFSPTYQQDVPDTWALKAGGNQYSLSSDAMVEYRIAATSEELQDANWELLQSLEDGSKHMGFGKAALGDPRVSLGDGAMMVTAVYPLAVFETDDIAPFTVLSDAAIPNLEMLTVANGPDELTVATFPAAATIRTGVSGDGTEMTLVTAVVQSNRYLIYMSGYARSDTFETHYPTFVGMMNSLRILTDDAPVVVEETIEDSGEQVEDSEDAGEEGGETAVGEWTTGASEVFSINYPSNWIGDVFSGFGGWSSSEEMESVVGSLFNEGADITLAEGVSALILVDSYEAFETAVGTDPTTALTELATQFTEETGLPGTFVLDPQEVTVSDAPAGYAVVSTQLSNGKTVSIVIGTVMGDDQVARFVSYVLGDDESTISLVTDMFLSFEFVSAE